ncbi:hypothetical protein [Streptomyces sp. NPDC056660]|uniref:hypothetical protein n=1 Tax=Streptomyces sp. NPDC056660 TaxID=3345897 RepID=UPI0036B7BD04
MLNSTAEAARSPVSSAARLVNAPASTRAEASGAVPRAEVNAYRACAGAPARAPGPVAADPVPPCSGTPGSQPATSAQTSAGTSPAVGSTAKASPSGSRPTAAPGATCPATSVSAPSAGPGRRAPVSATITR